MRNPHPSQIATIVSLQYFKIAAGEAVTTMDLPHYTTNFFAPGDTERERIIGVANSTLDGNVITTSYYRGNDIEGKTFIGTSKSTINIPWYKTRYYAPDDVKQLNPIGYTITKHNTPWYTTDFFDKYYDEMEIKNVAPIGTSTTKKDHIYFETWYKLPKIEHAKKESHNNVLLYQNSPTSPTIFAKSTSNATQISNPQNHQNPKKKGNCCSIM